MTRGRWHRNPVSVLLLCLWACGCAGQQAAGPTPTASPDHGRDGLVGVRWELTQVRGPDATVAIPVSLNSWFEATSRYAVQGDDGCNFFDGTGHRSARGFIVSDVAAAANGCADVHGPLDAAITGFGRVMNGQRAQVSLSGTELRLTAGKYTLVFAG
jgi:heat shock protein HslJ